VTNSAAIIGIVANGDVESVASALNDIESVIYVVVAPADTSWLSR